MFDTFIYCKMITTIVLANSCPIYFFFKMRKPRLTEFQSFPQSEPAPVTEVTHVSGLEVSDDFLYARAQLSCRLQDFPSNSQGPPDTPCNLTVTQTSFCRLKGGLWRTIAPQHPAHRSKVWELWSFPSKVLLLGWIMAWVFSPSFENGKQNNPQL